MNPNARVKSLNTNALTSFFEETSYVHFGSPRSASASGSPTKTSTVLPGVSAMPLFLHERVDQEAHAQGHQLLIAQRVADSMAAFRILVEIDGRTRRFQPGG